MYLTGIQLKRRTKNRYLPDSFDPCLHIKVALASEFQATNGGDYIKLEHCDMDGTGLNDLIGVQFMLVSDIPSFSIPLVELDSAVPEESNGLFALNLKIIE